MRTTLDLPDDILRRAKIEAVQRGSTLRQLVVDALHREIDGGKLKARRLTAAPVKLSADAPARHLSPQALKLLDAQAVEAADLRNASAMHR